MPRLSVEKVVTGKLRTNCYIVHDGREAVVFDPGGEFEAIQSVIESRDLTVRAVLSTHGHHDHVGAAAALAQRWAVAYHLHSGDAQLLKQANLYRTLFHGEKAVPLPTVDCWLDRTQSPLAFGHIGVEVIETPGHSPGGVCFVVDGRLLSGDTLFRGRVGRVDLPGGDAVALKQSLKMLATMDPQLELLPGHGPASTLGFELQQNEALREALL